MILVEPSAELEWITPNAEQVIERAGRTCYKSEDKITPDSASKFVKMIMAQGHYSVIEHAVASIRLVTDRGVTHEMVRHRIASYSQESTRYCNYSKDKFSTQIKVIEPPLADIAKDGLARQIWEKAMQQAEHAYLMLIQLGEKSQIARSVLPTCLKTEIVVTANLRQWCHIFELRLSKKAHPQIRQVMALACRLLIKECPTIFSTFQESVDEILGTMPAANSTKHVRTDAESLRTSSVCKSCLSVVPKGGTCCYGGL